MGCTSQKGIVFQVAEVHKTLLSVSKMARAGHTTVFSEVEGNYIPNDYTGERVWMKKRDGLYLVDLWVRACESRPKQTFSRQDKP